MTITQLNKHLDLILRLQEAEELLKAIQENSSDMRNLDGMTKGFYLARVTENISLILKTQAEEVARLNQAVKESEQEVKAFIATIQDDNMRSILSYRFLCGYKWDAVAVMMGNGYSAEAVKTATYRCLKRHEKNSIGGLKKGGNYCV